MSCRGIDQLFDAWEWKAIFWAGFIKIFVIYTNVPLPIWLFDHDRIGHPLGVLGFSDETSVEKLFDFLVYR
jgi:hypothetical protein